MNRAFAVAAFLCVVAAGIRTLDGQMEVLPAASAQLSDRRLLGFFHLTWYMVTGVFALAAVFLGALAFKPRRAGPRVVGLLLGCLFLVWSATIASVSSVFGWHAGTAVPTVVTFLIGWFALLGAREKVAEGSDARGAA